MKLGELATQSGLGSSFLSLLERNERGASRENLSSIAHALGVPPAVLLRVAGFAVENETRSQLSLRIQESLDELDAAAKALEKRLRAVG
jgi:transcriptional regulator with XRE-family HTH domain